MIKIFNKNFSYSIYNNFFFIYNNIFSFNKISFSRISIINSHLLIINNFFAYLSIFNLFLLKIFIVIFYNKNFFYKFIYIISAGLGFKKRKRRNRRGRRVMDLYVGNRHRLAY